MNLTAILGFVMLLVLMFLLFKGTFTPAVTFILLPLIIALLCGYDVATINAGIKSGLSSVSSIATLSPFAILFFGTLSEVGFFEPIKDLLMRTLGRNTTGLLIGLCLVTMVGHLDESATTTIMVTVPFFLPLFQKMKLDSRLLLLFASFVMGVMNLLPWGGPMLRTSSVTGLEAVYLWRQLLPIQIVGLVLIVAYAVFLGMKHGKSGADVLAKEALAELKEAERKPLTWKFWFNLAMLVILMYVLSTGAIASNAAFMIASAIVLLVNVKGQKEQANMIKKGASGGFFILVTIYGAAVFVGIMGVGEPSMLTEMANLLISILPEGLIRHLHIIMGILSVPMGMVFNNDAYIYGVMPLCIEVGKSVGLAAETMAIPMVVGRNVATMISPVYPPVYLLLGMAGVDLKDHVKYCFVPMWVAGIIITFVGVILGIYPL